MTYSVIESWTINGKERRMILRAGLTKDLASKVRACRVYANKVKGRDRVVEVVEEHEQDDRVRRVGGATR